MTTSQVSSLSEFGQTVVAFDNEIELFGKLSHELERLNVESDKGLERAIVILEEVAEIRKRIESSMRDFSKALADVQKRHEGAESIVAQKSVIVSERRQYVDSLFSRFKILGDLIQQINAMVVDLKEQSAAEISESDKQEIVARLPALDAQMNVLVEEAKKLMDEARTTNLQFLERNVDSLRKSLLSARNRIQLLVEK